jgi:15-cis-phytoene synthase
MNFAQNTPPATTQCREQERDLNACVELMRGGSKTFFAASRLLPPRMRAASIALYAFCRVADDLVDEGGAPLEGLAQLKQRLDQIYAGRPQPLVEDRALAAVVHQHQLPRPLLDALLEGFAWDAAARRYETLEDVQAYAARVAGSVGAMMSWLMGARHPDTLARACELGVAMQLTNIARDVGEDARRARLYLPRQWLRDANLDPDAWLASPVCSPQLQQVVSRLLVEADRLYVVSVAGIADLPRDCRSAILAARMIYAEIGQQLRRDGLDPVKRRAVVSTRRKLGLLAAAWLRSSWGGFAPVQDTVIPQLNATAYLVHHCMDASLQLPAASVNLRVPAAPRIPQRSLGQRAEWMLELFERQELMRQTRERDRTPSYSSRALLP